MGSGVLLRQPVTKRQDSFRMVSICFKWTDLLHTELAYSPAKKQSDSADKCSVCALAPHVEPVSFRSVLFFVAIFSLVFSQWCLYVRDRSSITPRYVGCAEFSIMVPRHSISRVRSASLFFR